MRRNVLNEETVKELIDRGTTNKQIAEICGVTPAAICNYIKSHNLREPKQEEKPQRQQEEQVKESICVKCSRAVAKSCVYGVKVAEFIACDYIGKNKKRRPCSPEACTVYKKKGRGQG